MVVQFVEVRVYVCRSSRFTNTNIVGLSSCKVCHPYVDCGMK
jgi:hypothetical protein